MSKRLKSALIAGCVASLLGGCEFQPPVTNDLSRIRDVELVSDKAFSISGLRYQALRDTALSVGARGGLAWRAKQIREKVYLHEAKMDRIFNFRGLMLDDNVIPPVLIEGRNTLEQPKCDILRVSDRQYMIIKHACFVTNPPTWRDYVGLEYPEPELPDRSLLPRDDSERKVWERYVQEGWQAGVIQANTIFLENIGRLKRDYEGMIRYHTLLAQNIVSKPFVARAELGVTGNANELAINDRVLRITIQPGFEQDSSRWEAEVTRN